MRILLFANQPYIGSGYGMVTMLFKSAMEAEGHTVGVCGWGLAGAVIQEEHLYPSGRRSLAGDDTMKDAAELFKPDVVIAFYDSWALRFHMDDKWEYPTILSTAVDQHPLDNNSVESLKQADGIVAWSQYGKRVVEAAGFDDVTHIPLGISTQILQAGDRKKAKKLNHDIPEEEDIFVVGMVGRNNTHPSRKGFPQALEGFSIFHKKHPDSIIYLHTVTDGSDVAGGGAGSLYLPSIMGMFGLTNEEVKEAYQPAMRLGAYGVDQMPMVYNSIDVLLQPSMGEGFGLPVLEAMACGAPVIASDCTSLTELVQGSGGWLVSGTPVLGDKRGWQMQADPKQIALALEEAYQKWKQGGRNWQDRQRQAIRRAKEYDYVTKIHPMWVEYLKRFEVDE